jgi:hypothetical protein
MTSVSNAIIGGLSDRKSGKEKQATEEATAAPVEKKATRKRVSAAEKPAAPAKEVKASKEEE